MLNHTFSKVVKIAGQRKMLTRYLVVTGASITQFTIMACYSHTAYFSKNSNWNLDGQGPCFLAAQP